MKLRRICFWAVFLAAAAWAVSPGYCVTLTVENGSGTAGQPLVVPIVVDDPTGISGAAFALQYSSSLTVTVDSTFFDTFYNQFDPLDTTDAAVADGSGWQFPLLDQNGDPVTDDGGNPLYVPAQAEVGSFDYTQPLLDNVTAPDTTVCHYIAGARCTPAAADESAPLFELSVSLKSGEPAGAYPIRIVPTTISNADAGYDPAGETVNLLIGSDAGQAVGSPAAFPVLLAADGYAAGVVDGQVEFVEDTSGTWSLDIDGNGAVTALTDGLLVMRRLMGFDLAGAGWTTGFRDPAAPYSEADIEAHLVSGMSSSALDIDGDGSVAPLTDGLLVMRYLLGFPMNGPGWTQGVTEPAATRDEAGIEAYIQSLMP